MKTVTPHTPLQYILGTTKFCGLDFVVNESVMIPRPETEVLVETVKELAFSLKGTARSLKILDLCTGSGNIAVSLANSLMARPCSPSTLSEAEGLTKGGLDCKIVASDISQEALDVAMLNADRHGASGRVEFIRSNLFDNINGQFDIIVSNPPYVARKEFTELQKEVLMEPRIALDGGDDGLDFYRMIISAAPTYLRRGGYLAMEIGYGQSYGVKEIIAEAGSLEFIETREDQYSIDRIVVARWKNL